MVDTQEEEDSYMVVIKVNPESKSALLRSKADDNQIEFTDGKSLWKHSAKVVGTATQHRCGEHIGHPYNEDFTLRVKVKEE